MAEPLIKNDSRFQWTILARVGALVLTISLAAFLMVKGWQVYLLLVLPLIAWQVYDFYRFHKKAQDEVEQFVEAIHYRDFSRYFDVKTAPQEVQSLRKGFNEINSTFKVISREKEMQYQYLQKILELVDTGILSYDTGTDEVGWMNESLKRMLETPYLRTVHSLDKKYPELYKEVVTLKSGEHKITAFQREGNLFKFLLSATAFQTEGKIYKLLAFQNVSEALDENESEAWRKLLSVMTHEIMNSVAPISSLAETLHRQLDNSRTQIKPEQQSGFEDLLLGIETIQRRSEGLLKFAQTYRNLNKITTLNLRKVYARDLFENMYQLMLPTLENKGIDLDIVLKDPDIMVDADTNLIEQVLINLIVNAVDALKDRANPRIVLSATESSQGKITLKVADNGLGIPQELIDKIFIPFFSTRKTGSGIGLSLCKQIMMLHKGNIQVQSHEGEGTAFFLNF
jgi:two-component system, NtrC family, nitrogen regulation sensor histidine kinase NtrY